MSDLDGLLVELRAAMAGATPGPLRAWDRRDDERFTALWDERNRSHASFPRDADAKAYLALRNSWPSIEAALAQAEADRAELERLRLRLEWAEGVASAAEKLVRSREWGALDGTAADLRAALRGER